MNKLMRKSPMVVAGVFLLVQVWGLADYSAGHFDNSPFRGTLFALALEASIFSTFYWTRQNVTVDGSKEGQTKNQKKDFNVRMGAFGAALLFMVASGWFNTLKATNDFAAGWTVGQLLYGITPTLFASVLGFLQGNIDRLPFVQAKAAQHPLMMRVYALIEQRVTLLERRTSEAMQTTIEKVAKDATAKKYKCDYCNKPTTRYEKGAHMRQCKKNPKNK